MQGRDSGAGHAWIVDGYKYKVTEHNIYVYDGTIKDYVYSESESFTDVVDLQHLNWGWNGKCNGYYNIDVFKTDSAVIPDTDFNKDIYDFTTDIAFRIITLKH